MGEVAKHAWVGARVGSYSAGIMVARAPTDDDAALRRPDEVAALG